MKLCFARVPPGDFMSVHGIKNQVKITGNQDQIGMVDIPAIGQSAIDQRGYCVAAQSHNQEGRAQFGKSAQSLDG